jgi:hypothetical protein
MSAPPNTAMQVDAVDVDGRAPVADAVVDRDSSAVTVAPSFVEVGADRPSAFGSRASVPLAVP